MSTFESNENSVILALIEQNFSLQQGLVDIIKTRDANEAERQSKEQMLEQRDSETRAATAKAQDDYYQNLLPTLLPIFAPLIQSLAQGFLSPDPQIDPSDFFDPDDKPEGGEQH